MGKHLSYNFHIWKNAYHRVFIQFSVRMKLYDKKFLIYGNCMIRSFGQPGSSECSHTRHFPTRTKTAEFHKQRR